MQTKYTGIILAGGENKRFNKTNKAFLKLNGIHLINHIYNKFIKIFKKIIIVTNNPIFYTNFDCSIVTDHYKIKGALAGIHAGLFSSTTEFAFFSACDTPFIKNNLILSMLEEIEINKEVILPKTSIGFEPLVAIYSKKCINQIEQQIKKKKMRIFDLLKKIRIKELPELKLRKKDSNLISFFNINNQKDLKNAKEYLKKHKTINAQSKKDKKSI